MSKMCCVSHFPESHDRPVMTCQNFLTLTEMVTSSSGSGELDISFKRERFFVCGPVL